jgi:hypothetical protein
MTDRIEEPTLPAADAQLLQELTERACSGGLKRTREGGLLGKLGQDGHRGRTRGRAR